MNQGPTITQQGNTLINLSMEQGCILFLQIPLKTMMKLIVFEDVLHCLIAMQNRGKTYKIPLLAKRALDEIPCYKSTKQVHANYRKFEWSMQYEVVKCVVL